MARLVAVANPTLADGFRLAGIPTTVVAPGRAQAALHPLLADDEVGLLLITRDLWDELPERAQRAVEGLARPLVLAVPAGEVTDVDARRALLGEMLERAIGYRIELGSLDR